MREPDQVIDSPALRKLAEDAIRELVAYTLLVSNAAIALGKTDHAQGIREQWGRAALQLEGMIPEIEDGSAEALARFNRLFSSAYDSLSDLLKIWGEPFAPVPMQDVFDFWEKELGEIEAPGFAWGFLLGAAALAAAIAAAFVKRSR